MAGGGSPEQLDVTAAHINKYLELKDLGIIKKYLGIDITSCTDSSGNPMFLLDQQEYINTLIEEYNMTHSFPVSTPMLPNENWNSDLTLLNDYAKKRYQALIGSLLYLTHGTRPDINYFVIKLSQYSSKPRLAHWGALKRVLRYLKGTASAALTIQFHKDDGLIGYFDVAHADNENRRYNGEPFASRKSA